MRRNQASGIAPVPAPRPPAIGRPGASATDAAAAPGLTVVSSTGRRRAVPGRCRWPFAAVLLLGAGVAATAGAAAPAPRSLIVEAPPHGRVVWRRESRPVLRVLPDRGDGWYTLAKRYCLSAADVSRLRAANPRFRNPLRGTPVDVPVERLRSEIRLAVVERLFPADSRVRHGWRHWVLDPFGGDEESWRWLAELFTGRPGNAGLLSRLNPEQPSVAPRRGAPVLIPEAHLLPVFRSVLPRPTRTPTASPSPTRMPPTARPTVPQTAVPPMPTAASGGTNKGTAAGRGVLTFGRDAKGEFAAYRLRRGEALYSAVVVRFTGQLHAAEVNATARLIARRSGIPDVTDIPVGYPIKIPVDLLLPEYLPAGDPRRAAWERERKELGRFVEVVRAADLSGVHVILDAGHGGADSGAVADGVWEATYAYDILCRIKVDLERHTRATVWSTIKDTSRGFGVVDRDVLAQDRDQVLLTHPLYVLGGSTTGVHLRWYLTNDIILSRLKKKVPRSKIVFLSIHADSLHPTVRGAMAYVPSRYLRPRRFSVGRKEMKLYREFRRHPQVKLSSKLKARAEASSRRLAGEIMAKLEADGLQVHDYEPIRGSVLRGRRRWVPAVLRYTLAQQAVLIECCNLANADDRKALLDSRWRERFARAVVGGIAASYGSKPH